jgi:hypothetical protein
MEVQERIGEIETHEEIEYEELRAASKSAEAMLLQHMQETSNSCTHARYILVYFESDSAALGRLASPKNNLIVGCIYSH